jgi:hypothetical protein
MHPATKSRAEGGQVMKPLSRITDRALGYLGLFLIGSISWTANRLGTSALQPGNPTRVVPLRSARHNTAGRTGVTRATTPRVAA